jgi:general secretion pathway protein A
LYNQFYNLKDNPFRLTPDPAFLYMTLQHREALAGLVHSACNHSGLTVLIGEAGTGKTTLLHVLSNWLAKRNCVVALCTNPTLTREEFFDFLLAQLGVNCSSPLKSRQLMALQETLPRYQAEGRHPILIVDEAQRLSPELLEEIRLLLNLETSREKLLEIIVAGQQELAEILRRPELRQLKQRVSCFYKLEPLGREELPEYLQHRLSQAGLPQQTLFPEDTIKLIYEFTRGVPRLVSSLCENALRTGFALQSRQVTVAIIREAAKDLDLVSNEAIKDLPLPGEDQQVTAFVPVRPAAAPAATTVMASNSVQPTNGQRVTTPAIPLESYASRQKSLGFLAGLIDRWK